MTFTIAGSHDALEMRSGKFRRSAHGWWRSPVRPALIDYAKSHVAETSKRDDFAWIEMLGILGVQTWLKELGIEHELASRPAMFGGHRVAVTTTGSISPMQPSHFLFFREIDLVAIDDIFWCAYGSGEVGGAHLILLGGMSVSRFREVAEVYTVERSGGGGKFDVLRVRASAVEQPTEWVCRIDLTDPPTTHRPGGP